MFSEGKLVSIKLCSFLWWRPFITKVDTIPCMPIILIPLIKILLYFIVDHEVINIKVGDYMAKKYYIITMENLALVYCYWLYIWSMDDWYRFCIALLLSLNAAVTRPESGIHTSGHNWILVGISNFSRPLFLPWAARILRTSPTRPGSLHMSS